MQTLILFGMGALGALVKDIFKDNYITLPKVVDGRLCLGFIGGIIIGGLAGYFVDNDPVTAFLGGYAGYQIIEHLVPSKKKED